MRLAIVGVIVVVWLSPLPSQRLFESPPLHLAAAEGDVAEMERLLAVGVPIDLRTTAITCSGRDGGDTALHRAAAAGQLPAVRWLLRRGASVHAADNEHRTPLDAAAAAGQAEAIDILLAAGAPITTSTFVAAARDVAVVRLLVQRGGDPRCGDRDGNTPLHLGHLLGRADAVAELAFDRAIWFAPDHHGNTPLALAVEWRLHDTVELAVALGVLEDRKLPADSPLRGRIAELLRDAPRKAGGGGVRIRQSARGRASARS